MFVVFVLWVVCFDSGFTCWWVGWVYYGVGISVA